MDMTTLYRQMANYASWKQQLSCQIEQCLRWFADHSTNSPVANHSLEQALHLLTKDQFTLACVGEFSRGKTEFINALLFSEYGQRLLPSEPGRTTMCPTEIFYDPEQQPGCVRLLPIETRRTQASLSSFKRIPRNWVTIQFDPASPVSISDAMTQIAAIKRVSEADARSLGFEPHKLSRSHLKGSDDQYLVEVPTWRHALVNLDHPLLCQGLRILDTPGLNALGNEPELTLNALHQADALVFLLGIDTGVSRSDQTIWEEHICALKESKLGKNNRQLLALLNKVDTLWDDLRDPDEISAQIHRIRETTARQLRLPMEHVLAASAKQGLLARASGDPYLLHRSQLPQFEALLSQQVARNQQRIAESRSVADALSIMQSTRRQLRKQLYNADQELEQLQASHHLRQDYSQLLARLRTKTKAQHQLFHRRSLDLRFHQRRLHQHLQSIQSPLAGRPLQQLITSTQKSLQGNATEQGFSAAIDAFFSALQHRFNESQRAADYANQSLLRVYRSVDSGISTDDVQRHCLQLDTYQQRLEQLQNQAQQFRQSLDHMPGQKQKLVDRFVSTLMQESLNLIKVLRNETELWHKEALAPIAHQTQYEKSLLEQQVLELTNLAQQQENSQQRLQKLKSIIARREGALFELDQVIGAVPIGTAVTARATPRQQSIQANASTSA